MQEAKLKEAELRAMRVVAERIRQERQLRKLTLAQLGAKIGLSSASISKIEMGKMHPTFSNLIRMAEVFEMPIGDLVAAEEGGGGAADRPGLMTHTRRDQLRMARTDAIEIGALCSGITRKEMSPLYEVIHPQGPKDKLQLVSHSGEEFVYVLKGRLLVYTEFYAPLELAEGDSCYLDSGMAHTYRSAGPEAAEILLVWHDKGNEAAHPMAELWEGDQLAAGG